jgi:hypothetical protein
MVGKMNKTEFVTVKVSMICEKTVEVEVAVPIDSLVKDEEGIYSFDEIQEKAQELADGIINESDFCSINLDFVEVVDTPDGFEYWQ